MALTIEMAERGVLPDAAIRVGIRRLLRQRLDEIHARTPAEARERYDALLRTLRETPIAIETAKANEQHYEVPTAFYKLALGRRLKYSSCYYPPGVADLDRAEEAMLALTCERAELVDGQDVLELGCGWGSLTLWMAEHYPASRILAVSNSRTQREHIMAECERRGITNVEVMTRDANELELDRTFDRVVSVEMFEHVRNYERLLARVASWLRPEGRLFVHIFCHGTTPYLFETEGDDNWLGRHFFTGGIMPSEDLFAHFQRDLVLDRTWRVDGTHYQRTARAWLENMDQHREEILAIFTESHGASEAAAMVGRWRIFFMACEELWGWNGGTEWWVSHYLFRPRK